MEDDFSIFHTGNFFPFHTKNLPFHAKIFFHIPFHTSILKFFLTGSNERYKSYFAPLRCCKQYWALPQTGPQVRKLRTQGFGLRICEPISYRDHLRICGKKLKFTANQQHHWDRFCNFKKKIRFYDLMYRQIWVDVFLKRNTLSPSSHTVERLFPRGAAIFTAK